MRNLLAGDGGIEEELKVFEHVSLSDNNLAIAYFRKDDFE
jgi:hypothetical protein